MSSDKIAKKYFTAISVCCDSLNTLRDVRDALLYIQSKSKYKSPELVSILEGCELAISNLEIGLQGLNEIKINHLVDKIKDLSSWNQSLLERGELWN